MMKIGRIIVDLKILGGPLQPAIERFGYERQVSGYCLSTGSALGLIIAWNKLQRKVETKAIKPNADFWQFQCVRMGEPMEEVTNAR